MKLKETLGLWGFAFTRIPLLFFLRPKVIEMSDERCVIKIPLSRRSKNHLGSMYFGALAAGADCAGGLIAMRRIQATGNRVSLVFKDFHAEFLKRAEGDVVFTCDQGKALAEQVEEALRSDDRVSRPVEVIATVPSKLGAEPVARFTLTLSLKKRI